MRRLVLIIVAIVILVVFWQVSHRGSAPKAAVKTATLNAPAPDFSLQDIDGRPLDLATYRGHVVLLDFWATWCTPCRAEIPHFVEYQSKYGAQGLQVIGISMDDDAKPVQEFYREFKMNYPVALGTAKLADAYGGVLGLPITFLIGRDGQVAAKYIGEADMRAMDDRINSLLQQK